MTHQPDYEWVSVGEASRRLNVSPSTIRRMIEAGALVGEREVIGGSKERYKVRLETQQDAPETRQAEQPTRSMGDALRDASAFHESALNILDMLLQSSLDAERQQAETIAELRERAARAEADAEYAQRERQTILEALRTAQAALMDAREARDAQHQRADDLAASLARARAEAEARGRRRWWRWPW